MLNVKELIPHRPPMLLVDEILEYSAENKTLTAKKTVRKDEYFLQGHYPNHPIVPGVIICEAIFQAGAALMSALFKDQINEGLPLVVRISNAKFKQMVHPGDVLELKADLKEQVKSAFYLRGQASVNGKTSATVDFTVMLGAKPQ